MKRLQRKRLSAGLAALAIGVGALAGVTLGGAPGLGAGPAAAETFADLAVSRLVGGLLASLPGGVKVTYDALKTDTRARTFRVDGLTMNREGNGIASQGTLGALRVEGVDIIAALSGKPFIADVIEIDRLKVVERPTGATRTGKKRAGGSYGADRIVIRDARVPSFLELAANAGDADKALAGIGFTTASIDGTAVTDIGEALARLRRKR